MFQISRIKKIRKKTKLTQKQVAVTLGISQANYARREAGLVALRVDELDTLANTLGVEFTEFWAGAQQPEQEGNGNVDHWEKEFYKLLGRYELLKELYERDGKQIIPLQPGVRQKKEGAQS